VKIGEHKVLPRVTPRHRRIECGRRKIYPKNSPPQCADETPTHAPFAATQIENKRSAVYRGTCQASRKFSGLTFRSIRPHMPVSPMRFRNGTTIEVRDEAKLGPSAKSGVEVGR
jgi:hypothetical protein